MSSKVYVRFPKAGLGNKLLTWSRAYVFARLNQLEMHTSSWFTFFIGSWLRRENKNRIYLGYFKQAGVLKKIRFELYKLFLKKETEPLLEKIKELPKNQLFVFDKIFREYDFFKEIRPYRSIVKEGIFDMLTPKIKKQYESIEKPVIGIHVRRGDFKLGGHITPIEFFVEVVESLREQSDKLLPVTIFTDADREEIQPLLDLPLVKTAQPKAHIIDILLLAESKILVMSVNSTFSYWAAFLSEGIVIKHPIEWHVPLRAEDDALKCKEIEWTESPDVVQYL